MPCLGELSAGCLEGGCFGGAFVKQRRCFGHSVSVRGLERHSALGAVRDIVTHRVLLDVVDATTSNHS